MNIQANQSGIAHIAIVMILVVVIIISTAGLLVMQSTNKQEADDAKIQNNIRLDRINEIAKASTQIINNNFQAEELDKLEQTPITCRISEQTVTGGGNQWCGLKIEASTIKIKHSDDPIANKIKNTYKEFVQDNWKQSYSKPSYINELNIPLRFKADLHLREYQDNEKRPVVCNIEIGSSDLILPAGLVNPQDQIYYSLLLDCSWRSTIRGL